VAAAASLKPYAVKSAWATLIIVTYDIGDSRRWRRVFKTMHGYGDWLQLSVFQCRLSARRRAELEVHLRALVKPGEDHVLLIDAGAADKTAVAVQSIDKTFSRSRGMRCARAMGSLP
jgi:CRISPR-associated protein Cas2